MQTTEAAAAAPAAEAPVKLATRGFSSIFDDASARLQEYNSTHQTQQPKKEKKKAETKEKKKAPDGTSPRRQASNIIGSHISPARIEAHLREGLRTELSDLWTDLTGKIRTAEARIKGKVSTDENASPDQKVPPTPAEIQQLHTNIAAWKHQIETTGCEKDVIRVSDNAPAALTAATDLIFLSFIDLAAANTLIGGKKIVEMGTTFCEEMRPPTEAGGISYQKHFVAPFLAELPTVVNYDQANEKKVLAADTERRRAEKAEKEKRKKAADEKAAQAHAAKIQQTRVHFLQQIQSLEEHSKAGKPFPLASGEALSPEDSMQQAALLRQKLSSPEFEALVPKDPTPPPAREETPRKTREATFTSYIDVLCKTVQGLHPSYEGMRVQGRFKTLVDHLIIEFVRAIAQMARAFISTHTLSGANILSMLISLQQFNSRPQAEIDHMRTTVQTALDLWQEHNQSEKERRKAEQLAKEQAMTPAELAALQEKRLAEERRRLENSYAAQRRREQKAAEAARKQEQELQRLAAAGAPAAGAPAAAAQASFTQPANPMMAAVPGMPGMGVPGLYQTQ
jgi:hypothetical protein